ncbi:MAG: phosphatase PAP2 family protein [Zoogloea sp.]|uniref:phosphatase PAP2 family protein n=1 Tax=Zoogloea sp. TaxID=49181 RepID=UPI0026303646|nr:phosphatase PAP2 family protein [Zoogloea sp.]MDD2990321.1 phosphatase PAP2 family protein [Zoogloea sp.]
MPSHSLPKPGFDPPATSADAFPRLWAAIPATFLVAMAAGLALSGHNQAVFLRINAASTEWLPPALWSAITLSGSVLGMIALLAPTLKTQPRWLAAAFLAAPLGVLFSQGGKRYFDVMRPAGVLEAGSFQQIGQKLYVHAFPSGHSTTAFLVAAVLILAWPRDDRRGRAALVLLSLAALIGLSRIAVGAHWPLDVLVGAAGGWLAGSLGVWLSGRLRFWDRPGGVRAMAAVAVATSLAMIFVDLGYPQAHLYQIGLAAWGIGGAAAALMRDRER